MSSGDVLPDHVRNALLGFIFFLLVSLTCIQTLSGSICPLCAMEKFFLPRPGSNGPVPSYLLVIRGTFKKSLASGRGWSLKKTNFISFFNIIPSTAIYNCQHDYNFLSPLENILDLQLSMPIMTSSSLLTKTKNEKFSQKFFFQEREYVKVRSQIRRIR